jgi:opacity protein-like surface antigen
MRALILILSICFATTALSQEIMPSGYIGVGIGSFDYEEDVEGLAEFGDSGDTLKLYGGYRFSDTFALEASYEEPDTIQESLSDFFEAIPVAGTIGLDTEILTLRAIGHFGPFIAGAGYFDADATIFANLTSTLGSFSVEESAGESGLTAALGLQWDFSSLSLRVLYEWFDIDDADASEIGVGLHYRFK